MDMIYTLAASGKTTSQIIKEVWGLSPSKSEDYQAKKKMIEELAC
jgi:hypothetical protein